MTDISVNPMEYSDYYYPVNISQVENLLGKLLTHIEAMNLPPSVEKANKDLIRQSVWSWWGSAQENSITSWRGCIGPIYASQHRNVSSKDHEYIWLTEVGRIAKKIELSYTPEDKNAPVAGN